MGDFHRFFSISGLLKKAVFSQISLQIKYFIFLPDEKESLFPDFSAHFDPCHWPKLHCNGFIEGRPARISVLF
jgi:hypothetical protein